MKEYHDLLKLVLEKGKFKSDRTGTGTYSVFGAQARFDLNVGFPLLTTKKIHLKSIIHELLWFLRGDTNVRWLQRHGISIWNEWSDQNGDLQKIYSRQWRRWDCGDTLQIVQQRTGSGDTPLVIPAAEFLNADSTLPDDLKCDFVNKSGHVFRVIQEVESSDKNSRYAVQFRVTGTTVSASRPSILSGDVKDDYALGLFGECVGRPDRNFTYYERAYNTWRNMIDRCYDTTSPVYANYGGRGIYVASRWKCFEYFLDDLHCLPRVEEWKASPGAYHLDKDYYGADHYGPNTCMFLSRRENHACKENSVPIEIFDASNPKRSLGRFVTIREAAEMLELDHRRIQEQLHGSRENYPDLLIRRLELPPGQFLRRGGVLDQIQNVIDRIKTKPDCRRIIVSAWNPPEVLQSALPPCHTLFQFFVQEGRLSCQLYQRSADLFLGVPFNIASYALLTMMVAQVCDLQLGDFVHTFGDLHIYKNHMLQVKEQLSREPKALPQMKLNPDVKDIFGFKYEDFTLIGYDPYPSIKAPVAV